MVRAERSRRMRHAVAILLCLCFAVWTWLWNPRMSISHDSVNILSFGAALAHPENFRSDPFVNSESAAFYPRLCTWLAWRCAKRWGAVGAHYLVHLPLLVAFLIVSYAALYWWTRSIPGALLVSCFSVKARMGLLGSFWGAETLHYVKPRAFAGLAIPILLICLWKFRGSWKLWLVFLATGLLANVNPPTAVNFAVLSLLVLAVRGETPRKDLVLLCGACIAFSVGAAPFLARFLPSTLGVIAPLSVAEKVTAMKATILRFEYRFYPIGIDKVVSFVVYNAGIPFLLALAGWILWKNPHTARDSFLLTFFLFALVVSPLLLLVTQKLALAFAFQPLLQLTLGRGMRFIYPVLYVYAAYAAGWLMARPNPVARSALGGLCLIVLLVQPLADRTTWRRFARSRDGRVQIREHGPQASILKRNLRRAQQVLSGEKLEGAQARIESVAVWARKNTPHDALFLIVHPNLIYFRRLALRSQVFSAKDGGIAQHTSTKALIRWHRWKRYMSKICQEQDVETLGTMVAESDAHYLVIPNEFPQDTPEWKQIFGRWKLVRKTSAWRVFRRPESSGTTAYPEARSLGDPRDAKDHIRAGD